MIVLVGFPKELQTQLEVVHRVAQQVQEEQEDQGQVPGRHHDRNPSRRPGGRRDRQGRPVLQLRHQRPHPDLPGHEPRRFRPSSCRNTRNWKSSSRIPFATIDQTGVGAADARWPSKGAARPVPTSSWESAANTAANPSSVKFCHRIGLTYVSCSPFRVPIARLAAAQAALEEKAQAKAKKK